MNYRTLGPSGLRVSEIGYGTWGLGGDSYGNVDNSASRKALCKAFDEGINFYDTSDLYGNGRSENLLGHLFESKRNQVIIATKGGNLPHFGFQMPQDFSSSHLHDALVGSLKRLRTDYIDLYQLHSPNMEDIERYDVVTTLNGFKESGKIREFGISARSPRDAVTAIERFGFKVVQVNFNLIDQRAREVGLFEIAEAYNVGIVVRTPLAFGFLAGMLTGHEQFGGNDHRSNWPREQLQKWADAPQLFAALNSATTRTYAQLALQFCLSEKNMSTVIPGMLNVKEVMENVQASGLEPLTASEVERIGQIYEANVFYDKSIKDKQLP